MKRLCVMVVLLIASLASTAHADQASQRQAVLRLLEVTNARQMLDQMVVQIDTMVDKQFDTLDLDAKGQEAARKVKKEMAGWLSDMLAWDTMKEMYVDIYSDVFTEDEINEMTAFYQSPLGRKMLQKMPALLQTTFARTQTMIQKKMPDIQKRLESYASDLESKYKKDGQSDTPQESVR
ncbi:MAG TPA: DUF2059 domain-containing protein [Geobacteraceae bacterium]